MDNFDVAFVGLMGGMLLAVIITMTLSGIYGSTRDIVFMKCAVGQNLTLRETSGTATFEVTFKDGGFASYTCTSNPAPPAN